MPFPYPEPSQQDTDHDLFLKQAMALYLLLQSGGGGGSLPDQTGHAGEFLTTNGTTASWAPISAAPALPVWTYTAGVIGDGLFTTSHPNIADTTNIALSDTIFTSLFTICTAGTVFVVTDQAGLVSAFQVNAYLSGGSFNVTFLSSQGTTWDGAYQFSIIPVTNISNALIASSITPAADGAYTPVTRIDTDTGIVTHVE